MITQEHLEHWINEINYQLNGISGEIDPKKLKSNGVIVDNSFVSFEYLNEKKDTIRQLLNNILFDIANDEKECEHKLIDVARNGRKTCVDCYKTFEFHEI